MFPDLNFKLCVISALMDLGYFEDEASEAQDSDEETEDFEAIPAVMEFYRDLELGPELLARVTSLTPDGGDAVYEYATHVWDGEDDQFDVSSIEGIEQLVNLERFAPAAMLPSKGIDFTPLLGCKKLKTVDMTFAAKSAENDRVRAELTARGVRITEG